MNIEKLKELNTAKKKLEKTRNDKDIASSFAYEYKWFFKEKQSLEALKRIAKWAKKKEAEIEPLRLDYLKKREEIEESCDHEIAERRLHERTFRCIICCEEVNPDKAVLVVDGVSGYQLQDLEDIFLSAIGNDKDPYDAIVEKINEINNSPYRDDEEIIVRRRR